MKERPLLLCILIEIVTFIIQVIVAVPVCLALILLRVFDFNYQADCLEDWWLHL